MALSTKCQLIAYGLAIAGCLSVTKYELFFEWDDEDPANKKIDPKVSSSPPLQWSLRTPSVVPASVNPTYTNRFYLRHLVKYYTHLSILLVPVTVNITHANKFYFGVRI